jgi:hypothetical protein
MLNRHRAKAAFARGPHSRLMSSLFERVGVRRGLGFSYELEPWDTSDRGSKGECEPGGEQEDNR